MAQKQSEWLKIAQQCVEPWKIPPLPSSNSDAAKDMRMVVALAVLSSLISEHVLLATYIPGGADLHDLLLEKAEENDEAESLCRALLLSLQSTEEQDEMGESARKRVVNQFITFSAQLLEPEQYQDSLTHLEGLSRKAASLWQVAQRSNFKIDAGKMISSSERWKKFNIPISNLEQQTGEDTTLRSDDSASKVVLVVFPGFVKTHTDRTDVIFPRIVVTGSQIARSDYEYRQEHSQTVSSLQRRPTRGRKDSAVGRLFEHSRQRFLGDSS
jgi:hypothetical protein